MASNRDMAAKKAIADHIFPNDVYGDPTEVEHGVWRCLVSRNGCLVLAEYHMTIKNQAQENVNHGN